MQIARIRVDLRPAKCFGRCNFMSFVLCGPFSHFCGHVIKMAAHLFRTTEFSMKRWLGGKRLRIAVLAAAMASAAVVVADDLYVQPERLDVREGPGLLFDPVDSVKKSDKVTVLEKTDDGWVKIQTPSGKTGYVYQKELADKPPAGPGPLAGLNVTSDSEASQMGTAAAAKGLEPEAENYAASKSYSKANLDRVIALNKTVKGKEWMQFCQDGQVGPAKPKH